MKPIRVLCVDDDPDIQVLLEIALRLDGDLTADIVGSGTEALVLAAERPYDVILLDGWMPHLDGYTVCQRLKDNPATADIPVVFLTANAQSDQLLRAGGCGAAATITKPFDPLTLAAELRRTAAQ